MYNKKIQETELKNISFVRRKSLVFFFYMDTLTILGLSPASSKASTI